MRKKLSVLRSCHDYLESVARLLRRRFDSLSLEVATFDLPCYERLVAAGYDGLAIYQETYLPEVYRQVHPVGPKRNGERRLQAMRDGGKAGSRSLGIGALLGLAPWRIEAFQLLQHAQDLTNTYWKSKVAVSFPRIRAHEGGGVIACPVSDRELVQMICTVRLSLPDAELVLSTREPDQLRDALVGVGVGLTRMSAGSRTNPGGYGTAESSGEQFEIEDSRTPSEVAAMLCESGLSPYGRISIEPS